MRNIISDDELLQEGLRPALQQYNLEQFTTADVPGHQHQVCRIRNFEATLDVDLASMAF